MRRAGSARSHGPCESGWRAAATRVVAAVDGIALTVERGEMVGYIGPNGPGKLETLKISRASLYPSAGQVRVCGLEPVPQRTRLARRSASSSASATALVGPATRERVLRRPSEHLFAQCSHYCELVSQRTDAPVLEIGIQSALSQRGVSVVAIHGRRLPARCRRSGARSPSATDRSCAPRKTRSRLWRSFLNDREKKTTLFCGAGLRGGACRVDRARGRLNAPIVHALRGKEYVEYDNPFDVGMTGCSDSPPAITR